MDNETKQRLAARVAEISSCTTLESFAETVICVPESVSKLGPIKRLYLKNWILEYKKGKKANLESLKPPLGFVMDTRLRFYNPTDLGRALWAQIYNTKPDSYIDGIIAAFAEWIEKYQIQEA